MKMFNRLTFILFALILTNCSEDYTEEFLTITEAEKQNFNKLFNDSSFGEEDEKEPCLTVNLIAGQNHIAGILTVDIIEGNFVITYSNNEDWLIYATHLSINNCEDDGFPTTKLGNPRIGHFEYNTNNSAGVSQVVYTIDASNFEDSFCIAAHAEVIGPTGGETAWAEGEDFLGKNWAMYIQGSILNCDNEKPDDDSKK